MVRVRFGLGLDGAFGIADLICSVMAAAVVAAVLWVARIRVSLDSYPVPVADSVADSYSLTSLVVELAAVLTERIETAGAAAPWAAHTLS